jgi:phosphatidylglycerophosphate synthase
MNVFWFWVESQVPRSMAPNQLTLTGSVVPFFFLSAMILNNPDLSSTLNPWLLVLGALAVFWFQTFDGIDGKHARATGTYSPIG